jgi:signal transduction histidine kinase
MKARNLILAPLLVMVLLTLLVGGTAYQQTLDWEKGVSRAANDISKLIILSNIHWGLRQIEQDLAEHPEQAQLTWRELQREVLMLVKLQHQDNMTEQEQPLSVPFKAILKMQKPTKANLHALLQGDFFYPNLDQVDRLKALQQTAGWMTTLITASMVFLGLILATLTVYDLDRLFQRLTHSRDLHIQLQEEERRRIAQDLHDGVVQELIDLKRHYNPNKVDTIIHNLRGICHNLKPQVLDDLGLAAALEFLADDLRQAGISQVHVSLEEEGLAQLPQQYELPLFRVVQELCSNIKHHAQATQARLNIVYNPNESPLLRGYVSDNGTGFDPQTISMTSMGIRGVQERLQQLNGKFTIHSQLGQGSKCQFSIPIQTHDPSQRKPA